MRNAQDVVLSDAQRTALRSWVRSGRTPARLRLRARIILAAAEGHRNKDIATRLGCTRRTVGTWRKRFVALGLEGIQKEAPRSGRKRSVTSRREAKIVRWTLEVTPPGAAVWSTRSLARAMELSETTVRRVWRDNNLHPRRITTAALPRDAVFAAALQEAVGLYLDFPEHALVLTCQRLNEPASTLEMPKYRAGRVDPSWNSYRRYDWLWLLELIGGRELPLSANDLPRARHTAWLAFLDTLEAGTPPALELQLLADNYATHRHPAVQEWLQRHPRFHVSLTPPHRSWKSSLTGWIRDLSQHFQLGDSFYTSASQLQSALASYKPRERGSRRFIWVKPPQPSLPRGRRKRSR